jgi:hypothetical protein
VSSARTERLREVKPKRRARPSDLRSFISLVLLMVVTFALAWRNTKQRNPQSAGAGRGSAPWADSEAPEEEPLANRGKNRVF